MLTSPSGTERIVDEMMNRIFDEFVREHSSVIVQAIWEGKTVELKWNLETRRVDVGVR